MSAKAQGDDFRDHVANLLRSAGFSNVEPESIVNQKSVDLSSKWIRDSIDGPLTYIVEAKSFKTALPLEECALFVAEYGEIIRKGLADRAWLISKGPISPKGREQIRSAHGKALDCLTFDELQRRLFGLDSYLSQLKNLYSSSGVEEYYVPLRSQAEASIEDQVFKWIEEDEAPPLAIMGAYGSGKSTFALRLAHELIMRSAIDNVGRIPILIPLDEIGDEQSIEGLMGKVLASRHRVGNYHYHLFYSLNENGRFVLIFDGFDEMKHGMTPNMFLNNVNEIMQLDRGKSKIIILGRNTVFHDDHEFKSIIMGRTNTSSGQEVRIPSRRPFEVIELQSFTHTDALQFVKRYFPYRAAAVWLETQRSPMPDSWIEGRVREIVDGRYENLIRRPVHAQMICDIATDPDRKLDTVGQYELYDYFIHCLFDREIRKKGRFRKFGIDVRRTFNSAVAWWLWSQGGISSISLSELPTELCTRVTVYISHDFDNEALKRELLAGCFVEKRGGTVYFPHRSIQEFLVADHIWNAILGGRGGDNKETRGIFDACTVEVAEFIAGRARLERRVNRAKMDERIVKLMLQTPGADEFSFEYSHLRLLFNLIVATESSRLVDQVAGSPLGMILGFFTRNGALTFELKSGEAIEYANTLLKSMGRANAFVTRATLFIWANLVRCNANLGEQIVLHFVSSLIPANELVATVGHLEAHGGYKVERQSVRLWTFLVASSIRGDSMSVDLEKIAEVSCGNDSLERISDDGSGKQGRSTARVLISEVEERLRERGLGFWDRKKLRRFFSDEKLQYQIVVG